MSFASEPPTAPGVLQHTAPRPAVFLSPHLSDEELAFHWTLSERDKCRTKNILTSIAQFQSCYAVGH